MQSNIKNVILIILKMKILMIIIINNDLYWGLNCDDLYYVST